MVSWRSRFVNALVGPVARRRRQQRARVQATPSAGTQAHSAVKRLRTPRDMRRSDVADAGVPLAWYTPVGVSATPVVLYLHGGGYIAGGIDDAHSLEIAYARLMRVRLLAVGYRLAPAHPFPAAVEDALTAYRWLLAQGVPADQIALMGESAGGGLALALLLAARDAGLPLPAAAVCQSPWVDLALTGASMQTHVARDPALVVSDIQAMATSYLGATDAHDPLASPLYADLHGLPPLYIQVGTEELLFDDGQRLAARAREAGVSVELETLPGQNHAWTLLIRLVPEAHDAYVRAGRFIRAQTTLDLSDSHGAEAPKQE